MAEQSKIYVHLYGDNNWEESLGSAVLGEDTAEIDFAPNPAQRYTFGVRLVAASETREANTHIVCCVEVNQAGELQPQLLPRPFDVTTDRLDNNSVRVGFSCEVLPPREAPSGFEILSDSGSGQLNEANPVATVVFDNSNQADFVTDVTVSSSPEIFAVRCIKAQQKGEISRISTSTPLRIPPAAVIL